MKNFIIILVLMVCCSCKHSKDTIINPLPTEEVSKDRIEVDLSKEYQTIHSFGASDCWYLKYIGLWANEEKKNEIADLLFSLDTLKDGQPKGIGLSLWRFNIGAGSYEQGSSSNIIRDWNREECFQNEKGEYNWNKQEGAQWFLNAAKQRGVRYTLGFSNSPPVHMTKSGKAFQNTGKSLNLKPDKILDFSEFLVTVSKHFNFDYISPLNEPQNAWLPGSDGKITQEGTAALNQDIYNVTKSLSQVARNKNYLGKIILGEAGMINFLYEKNENNQGDQIQNFFNSNSQLSLEGMPNVERAISYHSYWSTCDDKVLLDTRQRAEKAASQANNLPLWQSEFGVLGDVCGTLNARPRNTSIDYGLYIAKVMHHDLSTANVVAWHAWLAVSPANYSDALIYINGPDNLYQQIDNAKNDGIIVQSKQLWATGNFSRFIRPGMQRVNIKMLSDGVVYEPQSLMLSAYKDIKSNTLVIVGVNTSDIPLSMPLTGIKFAKDKFDIYTTDANSNLKKTYSSGKKVIIKPKSVTTCVIQYKS